MKWVLANALLLTTTTLWLLVPIQSLAAGRVAMPGQAGVPLVFVVSESNYMWHEIDGVDRVDVVRQAIGKVVDDLPADSIVGLIAYRGAEHACSEGMLLVPPKPLDRSAITAALSALRPSGKPDVAQAVGSSLSLLAADNTMPVLVLIADTEDRCGGDVAAVVALANGDEASFVMHVVALRGADQTGSLSNAAASGNGLYVEFADVHELVAALQQVANHPVSIRSGNQRQPKVETAPKARAVARERPLIDAPGWSAEPCECVPDFMFQSYGIYRPPVADEAETVPIRFGAFSRIAYPSIVPLADGTLHLNQPDRNALVKLPHRYQTKVDLVVAIDQWRAQNDTPQTPGVIYDAPEVQRNLTNDIAWLLDTYALDGVTLQLSVSPSDRELFDFQTWRVDLLSRLNYRLAQISDDKMLNVIVDYGEVDPDPNWDIAGECDIVGDHSPESVWRGRTLLRALAPTVDLILVAHLRSGFEPESLACAQANYLKYEMTGFVSRNLIVPVLGPDMDVEVAELARLYDDQSNFGGIAVSNIGAGGATVDFLKGEYRLTVEDSSGLKALQLALFPEFCRYVCPNRHLSRIAYAIAMVFFVAALAAAKWLYPNPSRIRDPVLLAYGIVLLIAPYLYALCVPEYHDDRFWVGFAAIALFTFYLARMRLRARNLARVIDR